jgi:hypothetical protein
MVSSRGARAAAYLIVVTALLVVAFLVDAAVYAVTHCWQQVRQTGPPLRRAFLKNKSEPECRHFESSIGNIALHQRSKDSQSDGYAGWTKSGPEHVRSFPGAIQPALRN